MPSTKKPTHTSGKPAASTPHSAAAKKSSNAHPSHNSYATVLVHGMCGWGRDELLGQHFRYWGGMGDIQQYLIDKGYETFTASMGPISSNWDRACELYAFLRGGVVDYGAAHAARYGHARYGRSYPGVFPQWSDVHKVHLIGHSQGGPTSRTLIRLLELGDAEEMAFVPDAHEAPTSDLFKGGKSWVHSLTSVAGVHNGAFPSPAGDLPRFLNDTLFALASAAGIAEHEMLYDFSLEQWGLKREHGQAVSDYLRRVVESPAWSTNDSCVYDLSTIAAHFQNTWAVTSPNVYYSAYAVDGTQAGPLGVRLPFPGMNPLLKANATLIGANRMDAPFGALAWRPSDGCVSVPSAQYPVGHAHEFVSEHPVRPDKGVWYVHPTLHDKDHISIITPSLNVTISELNDFYEGIARYNRSLPA